MSPLSQISPSYLQDFSRQLSFFAYDPKTTTDILPPAAVLPEQFHGRPEAGAVSQGIRALMHAVLDDALYTWKKQFLVKGRKAQRLAREAEEWFFNENDSWPFSFVCICETLDLDPDYIRRGIRRWRQQPPAMKLRAKGHPVFVNRSFRLAA